MGARTGSAIRPLLEWAARAHFGRRSLASLHLAHFARSAALQKWRQDLNA
jgi:hypothetical protein